jgi:hypothetical protein
MVVNIPGYQPVEKVAARRKPSGLRAFSNAKPGGLRRSATFFNGLLCPRAGFKSTPVATAAPLGTVRWTEFSAVLLKVARIRSPG